METYILGGGCFWCLDAVFRQLKGVTESISGYSGGAVDNPSYEAVCNGNTGHAEVVRVSFDPDVITPQQIFDVFFTLHDPTQLNRQGADVGTQYRSVMFHANDSQRLLFEAAVETAKLTWGSDVVTEISPLTKFWPAESYHQDFFAKNPGQGYCMAVVSPKVAKVRKSFTHLLIS